MERDNRMILRLPMISGHDCPVCNTFISNYKPFTLFGGYTKEGVRKTGVYLLCCDQCNLFFAREGQIEMIARARGFRPTTFPAEGTGSEILEKAYSVPEFQIRLEASDGETDLFSPKHLVFGEKRQTCLFCNGQLHKMESIIPVKKGENKILQGNGCDCCGVLYIDQNKQKIVENWINRSSTARESFLVETGPEEDSAAITGQEAFGETEPDQSEEAMVPGAFASEEMAFPGADWEIENMAESEDDMAEEATVPQNDWETEWMMESTGNETEESAIWDSSEAGGTVIPEEKEETEGTLAEEDNKSDVKTIPGTQITIWAEGEDEDRALADPDNEAVHLIVYAHGTQQYEKMRAIHNQRTDKSFTDISEYRQFASQYGKPDLEIEFGDAEVKPGSGLTNPGIQTALNIYGYKVIQADCLPDAYRQELLGEILDLRILTQEEFSRFFVWLILFTGSQYPKAKEKWQHDFNFVKKYRLNPERFMNARFNNWHTTDPDY